MSFFDYLTYQWTKGEKDWHIPYNNALTALKDFLGDKGVNTSLGSGLSAAETEIANGRDGAATLLAKNQAQDTRVNKEHNADGTHTASAATPVEFKASGDTSTYISTTSFKIPTDKTATYVKNRKLKITLTGGDVIATISSSSYSSPDTTITVKQAVIDNTISAVAYGIDSPNSTPAHPEIDDNTALGIWNAEQNSKDAGSALLMEKGWVDDFQTANEQGADEAASSDEQHDNTNKLYKGTDGGTGVNADFPMTTEANHIQKEESGTDCSISGDTVTINNSDVFGANVLGSRFSVNNFTAEAAIDVRTSSTVIQLPSGHGLTGTNVAWKIRFIQFVSGVAKLAEKGSSETISQLTDDTYSDLNGGSGSNEEFSQSFTAGITGNLTSIGLYIYKEGAPTDNFQVAVYAESGDLLTGAALSSTEVVDMSTLGTDSNPGVTTFTFSSPAALTASTKYVFRMWRSGARDLSNRGRIRNKGTASSYSGGMGATKSSGSWATDPLMDYKFTLNISSAANVITEDVALVPAFAQLKSVAAVSDINSISLTETKNSQSIFYAFIFGPAAMTAYNDTDTLVTIFNQTGSVWKKVIKWDGAKWQYNSDASNTAAETWTDLPVEDHTDIASALAQAILNSGYLQMTKADAEAITDAEFEATGGFDSSSHTQYGVGVYLRSTNNAQNPQVDLIRTNWDSVRAAMTFQSKTYDPGFVPVEVYLWVRAEHSTGDGPGTWYVSRDGGTTWTAITMTQQGNPITGNIRILRGTLTFTTEPSAQDLRVRYVTTQAKNQYLHSWGLQARQ